METSELLNQLREIKVWTANLNKSVTRLINQLEKEEGEMPGQIDKQQIIRMMEERSQRILKKSKK